MGTFVSLGLLSLDNRFKEVDLILDEANNNFERNDALYKALCRSAQVLLSAHFEGYLKELLKNSLEDINNYSSFKSSNNFLKRRLCNYFLIIPKDEKNSKLHNQKVTDMISLLDNLDTKFKKEYFFGSENNNPKATILDKIAEQFGVDNFFKKLKKSNLDLIFSNTLPENIRKRDELKSYLLSKTSSYPFSVNLDIFQIDEAKSSTDDFWDAFLSGVLKRRHDIAHGTEVENSVGHRTIESDKVKIEILIYAFTVFICLQCNPV